MISLLCFILYKYQGLGQTVRLSHEISYNSFARDPDNRSASADICTAIKF